LLSSSCSVFIRLVFKKVSKIKKKNGHFKVLTLDLSALIEKNGLFVLILLVFNNFLPHAYF